MNHRQKSAVAKFLLPVLTIAIVGAGIMLNISFTNSDTRTLTRAANNNDNQTNWTFSGNLDSWRAENLELKPSRDSQSATITYKTSRPSGAIISQRLSHSLSKGKPKVFISFSVKALRDGRYLDPSSIKNANAKLKLSFITNNDKSWDETKQVEAVYPLKDSPQQVSLDLSQASYFNSKAGSDMITYLKLEPYNSSDKALGDTIEFTLDNLTLIFE